MKGAKRKEPQEVAQEIIDRQDTLTIDDLIWASDVMVRKGIISDYEIKISHNRLEASANGGRTTYKKDGVFIIHMKAGKNE